MEKTLQFRNILEAQTLRILFLSFFLLSIGSLFGQDITINKYAVGSGTECNQFDITLEIIGDPPPLPQEVILVIDRSGSMDDGPFPEPIDYAKDAAIDFVNNLFDPSNNPTGLNKIGVVSYAESASLDINLTGSSGKQQIINAINNIFTGGRTNIEDALIEADFEMQCHGTFNCATSRNIILLTDGVANENNSGDVCSSSDTSSPCIDDAIQAGINARTITINGEDFEQQIFSIGLFGAISGQQQATATNTLDAIQDSGLFVTEVGADLTGIYNQILGQLIAAARQLPGEALVTDIVQTGFELVSGSLNASKGTTTNSGQTISWFVDEVFDETITLEYSILAVSQDACGTQHPGDTVMNYENSNCEVVSENFGNPDICVPCPEVEAVAERVDCTNSIDYSADISQGDCGAVSEDYSWEFYLNNDLVGTSSQMSGTYTYSGSEDFTGSFRAVLSYDGTYGGGCQLPSVVADTDVSLACDIDGWEFACGDDKTVDEYGYNANCSENNQVDIPDSSNVYQYVVELVYKGNNPGPTIQFEDDGGVTHVLNRSVPVGNSSNIWVYRGLITGNTSSVIYNNTVKECNLQSIVVYVFRNVPNASSNSGVFTNISGVNNIKTLTIDIPSFSLPRDLLVEVPISELTPDGRYLLLNVEAGGVSDQVFIYGPDSSLPGGTCCLAIPAIALDNVPGSTTQVTITIDTRNGENGQSVNGQSYVLSSGVNVEGDCFGELDITAEVTDVLCFGETTGSITVTATGGLPPYMYSLNGGTPQSSPTFDNLAAGGYTVTVEDSLGNTDDVMVTVGEPTNQLSIAITSQTDILCGADGSVTVEASGGTSPYEYSLDGGTPQGSGTFNGLTAGTYTISVLDENDCDTSIDVTILANCTIAIDDINDTFINLAVGGNVLTNDIDLEGDSQVVTSTTVTSAEGVSVTINSDGSYIYTPALDYVGEDSFEYAITDDGNPIATDTAMVYIDISPLNGPDNDPPVANADTNTTEVDTPVSGNVLPNDFDPDGDPIVVTANTDPNNGTVVINPDGSYTYTPDPGFTGEDTFEYTICDNGNPALCDTATVTIQVIADMGNITVANDDAYNGLPDTDITGNVLDNDNDPEGDSQVVDIAISPISGPSNGSVVINTDGSFTYTPNAGYGGTDQFVYGIEDDGSPVATDQATVYITISPNGDGNDILAIDDINDTYINLAVSGTVATNDENTDGPAGTEVFTLVSGPTAGGTLVFNADGSYTYTPALDYVGEDTFVYQICDGGNPQACDTATVYIEILPLNSPDNDPPVANADTNTTEVDTPVSGNVLPNDFDPDGDPIVVTANTDPSNGTVVINPDGSYTYTPDPGFTGEDTFEYTICDNGNPALCDTATVTIQVIADMGNITVANDDAYNGLPDTDITGNVLDNDNDPEGDSQVVDIAISPISGPSNGSVVINSDGSFTYTPNAGYGGTDQFVYGIEDDGSPVATDQATVYITISPNGDGNDILAIDDINDTYINLAVSGTVATNDENTDGPAGTEVFTLVSGPTAGGTLVFNADGSYTYTPALDYVGEDTFVYQICDGGNPQACDTATVYIEILPLNSPDNDPPVANADTNTTEVDVPVSGNVLPNDFDPDGDPIVVTANTDPNNGTVVINPDGSYTYTPDPGFTGEDTFEYTICDNGNPALCDTATVTIQVIADMGNITVANDDAYNGLPDTDITANVLDNDNDPEGDSQVVDIAISPISGPSNGSVVINTDGSFTYTPNAGYGGTDQFVYGIEDDGSPVATDQATVYITISPNGDGNDILAIDDINDTYINLAVSGTVATNDENTDGPAGTEVFTLVSGPTAGGTLVFNADGSYTYTPALDYVGEDTFVYQICDGGNPQACDTATVYIEILPLNSPDNDPPVANADTNTTEVDTPVSGNVLPNDFDPDGDPIVVTANTDPNNGTVVINPDGSYTYTPDPGFTGEDTFEYTICDNGNPALCDTATVTIQVIADMGNITVANDDAYNGLPDTDITGNVLDNDNDPEGDSQVVDIAISPISGPSNGSVVINTDGSFTYTPNAGYGGTDQFVYGIEDDGSPVASDQATVYITISPNGDGNDILAIDDINDTFINLAVSGTVATNDENTDGPAGTEVFTLVSGPTAGGTLVFNADGSYTYTPALDYVGEDTFVYQICDGGNPQACDTATVYIEILPLNSPDNDPPVANADTNTTEVDTPVSGNVLPNDFDPDGDPIVVTANTDPSNGTVVINPDGSYTYTPDPGFTGEDTFEYTICDNGNPALCDTATVTIQVIADMGNITVANDDAYNGLPDTDITANVLDNDNDPEGDSQVVDIAISPISGPSNGSVVINTDGSFTYTPNAGYGGTDQFVYGIEDDGSPVATDQATVYITISPNGDGNDILAIDDINDTYINLAVSGTVATNDENTDGPAGTEVFTLVSGPTAGGTLVFNADGSYTYTPALDYVGEDTFVYQICDGGNPQACDTATVTIEIVGDPIEGNDPPVANNDTNVTEVDVPVSGNVLPNDFDPDGDPIVVTANTDPNNGTVVINPDGSYTYTPDAGFTGEDTFEYTICDNGNPALCDTAIVVIYILADNGNITAANDDAYYGEIDTDITGNVLDNDNDPEGDSQVVDIAISPISGPSNGSVVINADGTFVYTPGVGFIGADQFVYGVEDDGSPVATDLATVYILIAQTPDPAIAIVKSGVFNDEDQDSCSDVDETITYTFTVTNEGNVPLGSITISDPLLEAPNPIVPIVFVSGDANGDDLLDVDETWVYTADYAVTQVDIDAGEVINQATAEGTDPDGTLVTDLSGTTTTTDDTTVITLCQDPLIAIVKTSAYDDGGDCSQPGELIEYTFTVTNQGNVSLSNVLVDDPLLGGNVPGPDSGDTDADGELDVTETWIFTGSYAITQDDIDVGEVLNQATATGTAPGGTDVSDLSGSTITTDDGTITELCNDPLIAIVKTSAYDDGGDCSQPGELIEYTFTVTNQGNVSLSNVLVDDPLLGGNVPGPDSGDTDADGELDVTETWIFTGSYAITQDDIDAGEVLNQATATGTAPDGTDVSDLSGSTITTDDGTITELCNDPLIAIVKTGVFNDEDQDDCSDIDETISYTLTVTNEGNVSLSNIVVNDPLLGGVIAGPASGDDGDGILQLTETWVYEANYAITQQDIDNGQVENQATATGTAPDGTEVSDLSDDSEISENDPTITPLCQDPAIAIIKTGIFNDEDQDACSDVGETIDYTFTVTNEGNVSLSTIVVDDPLLGGPVAGPLSGDDGDGILQVDEIWVYEAEYTITQADIDAGVVTNQATATGSAPDGSSVSDLSDDDSVLEDDPTDTTLCQEPSIAVIKVGDFDDQNGDGCANVGETITYMFTVANTGNVTLTSVTIADPLVTVVGGPIVLAPAAQDNTTFTAVYTITQADIDAGEVVNQATATGTAPDGNEVNDLSDDNSLLEDDPTVTQLCQLSTIALIKEGEAEDQDESGCGDVGETIEYSFSVTNLGNVPLTNVTVTDPLVAVTGGPITLAPGQTDTTTFTAFYTITQQDVDTGFVINQATAEGTANGEQVTDLSDDNSFLENDPTITDLCMMEPSISLEKAGVFNDDNGDLIPQVGETISYSFSVTNTGNVTIFNIDITDPLPGIDIQGGPIASLAPGETDSTTFTATYAITQSDIDNEQVINQALATGTDSGGNQVEDQSDDPNIFDDVDNNGDGEPDDPTVTIIPVVDPAQFEIFNGITPNGDGLNDYFEIRGIADFPNNNVKIFNRWGVKVWETDGYNESDNVFRGESNGRATVAADELLPTGTYFYILNFPGESPEGIPTYNGYLYINR